MDNSIKKYSWFVIILGGIATLLVLLDSIKGINDLVEIITIPLVIFIPMAVLIVKFKFYKLTDFGKKYSRLIAYTTIGIMTIITPMLPHLFKLRLFITIYLLILFLFILIIVNDKTNTK